MAWLETTEDFILASESRGLELMMVGKAWEQVSKQATERSCFYPYVRSRDRRRCEPRLQTLKPKPSDVHPPARLHVLKVSEPPQTMSPRKKQCFNTFVWEGVIFPIQIITLCYNIFPLYVEHMH